MGKDKNSRMTVVKKKKMVREEGGGQACFTWLGLVFSKKNKKDNVRGRR